MKSLMWKVVWMLLIAGLVTNFITSHLVFVP